MNGKLSLRARLILAVAAIIVAAFSVADVIVFGALRSYLYGQVDSTLEASDMAVEAMALNPGTALSGGFFVPGTQWPPPANGPSAKVAGQPKRPGGPGFGSAFCALGRESAPGMFIEVRNATGEVVTAAAGQEQCAAFQPGSGPRSPRLPAAITGFKQAMRGRDEPTTYFTTASTGTGGPTFRVLASKLADGDVLVLATPISSVSNTLSQLVLVELVVTGGALVAAVGLSLWLVRLGLRPLRDIERTAEAISGGDLMHRVPNPNPRTEVGHLAAAFNVMLGRVERLFADLRASQDRLRRFVGDASHELRTPIAAISAYTQLFKEGAASRPDDLARAMSGIERESARMARLVEDLLTLARLDEHRELAAGPVELVDVVVEACETARLVGPAWPVRFVARDAVEVVGDRSALRQVVDNLLANVRAHTPEGTEATVTVAQNGAEGSIEVADNGPGITEEQGRIIFERFARLDSSRSRETGGTGLGLAIVASIVEAHGGTVMARPGPDGGSVFKVILPAT
ncbi:MAG TPA: HAMP domain-containing sensor histidine kinase [Acidimicrobiales bacterium]|nr:HAMP domain-containing sensor histidine kinase [Acidimicrobiales bacterium]